MTAEVDGNGETVEQLVDRIKAAAAAVRGRHRVIDAAELRQDEEFVAAVERLAGSPHASEAGTRLLRDGEPFTMQIVFAAIAAGGTGAAGWHRRALRRLARGTPGELPLVLDALAAVESEEVEVLGEVLNRVDESWLLVPVLADAARRFVDTRVAAGDELAPWQVDEQHADAAIRLVERAGEEARESLLPILREAAEEEEVTDADFFAEFASTIDPAGMPEPTLVGVRETAIEATTAALAADPRRSILLVGEPGVGKTTLIGEALRRTPDEQRLVFQATAAAVHSGQSFVGMLEGRVLEIVSQMRAEPIIWLFPNFEESLWAGQHLQSPRGLLDALLPYVETREIAVIGEIDPLAYEMLVQLRPRVVRAFDVVRLTPMAEDEALAVASDWTKSHGVQVSAETLREALDLASHYLPGTAAPGNVLRLLELTLERRRRVGDERIVPETVIATLGETTGLPLHILDPRTPLPLATVHEFLTNRVLGQPEAVQCLVERIAMVKAGLTDPTRPLGVYFFVGPTGSGKTELAKSLAEFLFGSADRLVRLDMSEFQTAESLERLLTDSAIEPQAAPLISSVRKEPFSVVLLDEFDKAHSNIWDVFLQVFDDGRLTDRSGRTVDFRHCVVVMTSNIGSAIPTRAGLGFGSEAGGFDREAVHRAVSRSFRPEFLNRLDRIVVFRPLDRDVMREILQNELTAVLKRRGFRMQPWAIEWDESAIDFLLERGFSSQLGARPLKRAIEQHVLAPLAMTIVERQFPEGDQFLFLTARSGRRIGVTFVDPDDGSSAPPDRVAGGSAEELTIERLVVDPAGDGSAVRFLAREVERVGESLSRWLEDKERLLTTTHDAAFWESADRHDVLARIEYLDRLQAAAATAERLLERLKAGAARSGRIPADLTRMLAERLFVLERAADTLATGEPYDAFVSIRPSSSTGDPETAASFAEQLAGMYLAWGDRRGMRIQRIPADGVGGSTLGVSGLGAFAILKHESGIHVLETPRDERSFARTNVQVTVAPWVARDVERALADAAADAIRTTATNQSIVRRYRREPSPLVRDSRGWRSGRLDSILDGDFDVLLAASSTSAPGRGRSPA